jgi:hypothetical protein
MKTIRLFALAVVVSVAGWQVAARGEVSAWFAPSAAKVLRDAKPNADAGRWDLAAAQNEVEACQLVLLSDQPVADVKVTVSDLRLADGSAALAAKLYKVEYVPNIVGETAYPDPLPPLGPLNLQPNQAQPVWISIRVPKDAKPGDYAGMVRVDANGKTAEYPLQLHVWGFALPDTPSSATAFGIIRQFIAEQQGEQAASPKGWWLYQQYYEMLLDHRISAYEIPADLMSPEAAKYLNDPRMTAYQIPYPTDDAALKALVARLKEGGWYSKGYFYPIDEPVKKDAYEQLAQISDRLHQLAPGYRWVVPFYRGPEWDEKLTAFDLMTNRVNLWCPNSQHFDGSPATRPALDQRRRLGEPIWWYVCCGPGEPYNNFFIEMPAMSHRMLFWQQKRENVEGLLYWSATYWAPNMTKDPWTDMATVKDINPKLRGDGSLFYPGKPVGIEGPVSSLRLEVIRDGLEDFDYLTLADAKLGKEATLPYVTKLAPDLKTYEHDPLALEKVRRELGDLLEKAVAAGK